MSAARWVTGRKARSSSVRGAAILTFVVFSEDFAAGSLVREGRVEDKGRGVSLPRPSHASLKVLKQTALPAQPLAMAFSASGLSGRPAIFAPPRPSRLDLRGVLGHRQEALEGGLQ